MATALSSIVSLDRLWPAMSVQCRSRQSFPDRDEGRGQFAAIRSRISTMSSVPDVPSNSIVNSGPGVPAPLRRGEDHTGRSCACEFTKTTHGKIGGSGERNPHPGIVFGERCIVATSACPRIAYLGRYPQERHRQPPPRRLRRPAGPILLARLRPRQQGQGDGARRRRVHPPLPPARAPARLHPAVSLRSAPLRPRPIVVIDAQTPGRSAKSGSFTRKSSPKMRNR